MNTLKTKLKLAAHSLKAKAVKIHKARQAKLLRRALDEAKLAIRYHDQGMTEALHDANLIAAKLAALQPSPPKPKPQPIQRRNGATVFMPGSV